jgi:DNA polymerase III gamma/tau subunit
MDRDEHFEDLDGNIDEPATEEIELDEVKDDEEIDVEISSAPGEDQEQPEPEPEPEEEPSPKAKEDQEESEDDLSSYSKRVRKRIERERRIARAAKAEADALRQQLDAARRDAEALASTEQIDATLAEKRAKLKAVREEFDPEKVDEEIDLIAEITDLQTQKRQLGARGTPPATKPQTQAPSNPRVAEWLGRNKEWFDRPEYLAQSTAARQIDQSLIAEGYSPSDAGYFEELDRRLSKTVRLPTHTRSKAAVSPVAPVAEGVTRSKTRVVLSKQDLAFMEKMGLDTNNPQHLKAFAAERRNSLRSS